MPAHGPRERAPDDRLRKQSIALRKEGMDYFVASLLAMTAEVGGCPCNTIVISQMR
jgi:hypothetical protein